MKALIPAAGYGTRFLPATKATPKEMLPIGCRPALQWLVEEALEAGADEVIIVTSPGKASIREYFTPDPSLIEKARGRPEIMAELERLDAITPRIRFAEQREQLGLGHAILQAADLVGTECDKVLILLGDALVSGVPCCSREIIEVSAKYCDASIVGLEKVPAERVSRYGIVAGEQALDNERVWSISGIIEKPVPEQAPSNLAIAGRYLLDRKIFELLADQRPGVGREIQLTDAIVRLLSCTPVYGYCYPGRRHDIGNPAGYLEALRAFVPV